MLLARMGKLNKKQVLVGLLALMVLAGGAANWFLYLNPGRCAGPLFDRHGLPDALPLPAGCSLQVHSGGQPQPTPNPQAVFSDDEWVWTVSGSDPAAVSNFYSKALAEKGWKDIQVQGGSGIYFLAACQEHQYVSIKTAVQLGSALGSQPVPVAAPAGGAVLSIQVLTTENAAALATAPFPCSG